MPAHTLARPSRKLGWPSYFCGAAKLLLPLYWGIGLPIWAFPGNVQEAQSCFPFQGNRLSESDLEKIDLGMGRLQVQEFLGKPVLQAPLTTQTEYYVELQQEGALASALRLKILELSFNELQLLVSIRYRVYLNDECIIDEKQAPKARVPLENADLEFPH